MPTLDIWRIGDLAKHACPDWDFLEIRPTDPEAECCTCQWVTKPEYDSLHKALESQTKLLKTVTSRPMEPMSDKMRQEVERLQSKDSFDLQFIRQEVLKLEELTTNLKAEIERLGKDTSCSAGRKVCIDCSFQEIANSIKRMKK